MNATHDETGGGEGVHSKHSPREQADQILLFSVLDIQN